MSEIQKRKHISGIPFHSLLATAYRKNLESSHSSRYNKHFFRVHRFKCVSFSKDIPFTEQDSSFSTDTEVVPEENTLRSFWHKVIVEDLIKKYPRLHLQEAFGSDFPDYNPFVARKVAKYVKSVEPYYDDESDVEESYSEEDYQCSLRCQAIYKRIEELGQQFFTYFQD